MNTIARRMPRLVTACLTATLLAACGGGDDKTTDANTSTETTQSASANGVVVADDAVRAQSAVLATARAVVAVGSASQTVNCAGGGTALFTATAGTSGSLANGLLDTGEVYAMQFVNCRSATGSATVSGALTLTVNAASGDDLSVSTSTQAVVVGLPQRTVTFNGSSTLSHTVQTTGTTQVVTDRWQSPLISMVSVRNGRTTSLTLSNIDLSRSITLVNGVLTGSSSQGGLTMAYFGPVGNWTATIGTQGVVSFDALGVPLAGRWLLTLPRDLIALEVANSIATVMVDFGRNGSIDRSYVWPVLTLTGGAG